MNKVQLSLTPEETAILESYGKQFGYSLPKTLRYIISKAAESFLRDGNVPVYGMNSKTEQNGLKAIKEFRSNKTIPVNDTDEFIDSL